MMLGGALGCAMFDEIVLRLIRTKYFECVACIKNNYTIMLHGQKFLQKIFVTACNYSFMWLMFVT